MKNPNPASELADKLPRFDQAVWGKFLKTLRQASADYRDADQKTRQRTVDTLHEATGKHAKTLIEICYGQEEDRPLFDLAWDNRTAVQEDLKGWLRTVSDELNRHFPRNKDELARRLESPEHQRGRTYPRGLDGCGN